MCKTLKILAFLLVIFALLSLSACKKEEKEHKCEFKLDSVIMAQSCTDDGLLFYSCSCGETKFERQEATGHVYGEWNVISEATCSSVGTASRVCSVCSNEESTYTSKLTHSYVSTEEEVNGVLTTTYCCELCSDVFSISSTLIENFAGISAAYLTDCAEDFYFDVICAEGEDYIRENLRIFDSYYEGTEEENATGVIREYTITNIDVNVYRIAPQASYSAGETYKAVRTGGVVFKDYGLHDLTFSIFREETEVVEINEGVIFLQKLENNSPGYYPYTLEYSENSDTHWLTLKKIEGLGIGDVICVGNATNIDDVFSNIQSENTFGKISSIVYNKAENHYIISLDTPKMSEIFDEIDIYTSNMDQVGEVKLTNFDDLTDGVTNLLLRDEDFINFAGASYVTTMEYLDNRGLATPIASFKDFLDSIKIDKERSIEPSIRDGALVAKIIVVGEIAIPVTLSSDDSQVGSIVISFEAYVSLDYLKPVVQFKDEDELENSEDIEISKLKIGATQSVTVGFEFNVEISIDYSMDAKPYVYNLNSRIYHYGRCQSVASMKLKNMYWLTTEEMVAKVIEGTVTIDNECKSCRPISAIMTDEYVLNCKEKTIHIYNCQRIKSVASKDLLVSTVDYGNLIISGYTACHVCHPESRHTNSFSESLLEKIKTQDFGQNADEIKAAADEIRNSNTNKEIQLGEFPFTAGPFKFDLELWIYVDFKLEASLKYEYQLNFTADYGLQKNKNGIEPYFGTSKNEITNCLTAFGEARFDVGAKGVIRASFIGLEKKLYASLNAKLGLYAELHGALQLDFINKNNSFMTAYFESGLHCHVYGEIRIPIIARKPKYFDIVEPTDFPIWNKGYGKVCFNYVDIPEELIIDSLDFSLDIDSLLMTKCYDLVNMTETTMRLESGGKAGRYTIQYSLANGNNCFIRNDVLYVGDATVAFEDQLTITVIGHDTWNNYRKDNTYFTLPSITIDIKYNGDLTDDEPSEGLEYELNWDGESYTVVGIGTCTDRNIKIPRTYNGKPVTAIGERAFYNCKLITKVVIPVSVETINRYAFDECTDLKTVVISNGVKYIDDGVFSNCISLSTITIPDSVETIGFAVFTDCVNLTSIEIIGGLEFIDEYNFLYCNSLEAVYITDLEKWCKTNFQEASSNPLCSAGNLYLNGELVTDLVIPKSVTEVNKFAFYNCTSITTVRIHDKITKIGDCAFSSCSSLTGVYITDLTKWCDIHFESYPYIPGSAANPLGCAQNLYLNGQLVVDLVIPEGVEYITNYAFQGCTSIKSIHFPESLTEIWGYAFSQCDSIEEVYIPGNVKYIGSDAFSSCKLLSNVTISEGVEYIGSYAFSYCDILKKITIPSTVSTIGMRAFSLCYELESVSFSNSISIGQEAFHYCNSLKAVYTPSVEIWCNMQFYDGAANPLSYAENLYVNGKLLTELIIPDGIKSIGDFVFANCTSITKVYIPESLTYFGDCAFSGCQSLTGVYINNLEKWCKIIFEDYRYIPGIASNPLSCAENLYLNGDLVTNLVIPNGITKINDGAFMGCTSIVSVEIPNSVTTIGEWAFINCTSISRLVLSDSIVTIDDNAFFGCNSITSITLPTNLKTIGEWAFASCENLTTIFIPNSVTKIGSCAFYACYALNTIYCEAESKPSGWNNEWNYQNVHVEWNYKI